MSTTHSSNGALSALDAASVWLSSEPLTAEGLRGRVVLVDFWTYSCVNWLRTLPYLSAWEERYRDRGFVLVGAHAPEFGFEHDLENVRNATRELGVAYPVVIDNEFRIWRSFGNHYWPAVYLIGPEGEVRFRHFGEGAYGETERAIQQLLGVEEETVGVAATGVSEAADLDTVGSPETYLGSARAERRSHSRGDGLELNHWALEGAWSVGAEAAVLDSAGARSATASGPATSTSCWLRRREGLRSVSSCASTGSRPAMHTASTSTLRARAPSQSRGCTSSSASERELASATSRSRSWTPACALTCSRSAESDRHGRQAGVSCVVSDPLSSNLHLAVRS
jgi:thiol-disulfide isomerase/thioredoxin